MAFHVHRRGRQGKELPELPETPPVETTRPTESEVPRGGTTANGTGIVRPLLGGEQEVPDNGR